MTPLAHPLVGRYLTDLDRLLAHLPPGDRAEMLAGVSEHIEASLPQSPGDEEVRRVLGELGPPQAVADEAYAGAPGPRFAPPPMPTKSRHWMPVVACVLMVLAVLLMLLVFGLSPGSSSSTVTTLDADGNATQVTSNELVVGPGVFVLGAGFVMLPFWLAATALAALAPTWSQREKTLVIITAPGLLVLGALLPWLGGKVAGVTGQTVLAWVVIAAFAAAIGNLVVLTRRALRRTA